jgi:threonylcarbamoyladenosine tRNA methylthiotransferase MtaB
MIERTCRLVTLGCKVNQYETQLVREALEQDGWREAGPHEPAGLCVVNTCTVTAEGDAKSRQQIRRLARENPGTRTVVMGCYATRDPQAVAALPGVAEVLTDKRELPDLLQRLGVQHVPSGISRFDGRHRAFVKIQDGCILRCTYCIIPQVRPGLRSRPPEEIADEVRRLVEAGYLEIVLTGIHVGHYGVEATRGRTGRTPFRLWHLLERLDRVPGTWRLRLSSLEAGEIGDDFLRAAAGCERLCPHFHPALQSGTDRTLARMRRRYSIGPFLEKVDRIRAALPDATFTTDVIVGFPGETESDFEATLDACRRAGFLRLHAFSFSPRKGTPAAAFPDRVPGDVIRARCARLAEVERETARAVRARRVGRELEVFVEGRSPTRPGGIRGFDRSYVPVECPGNDADESRFVRVRATADGDDCLLGERIDRAAGFDESVATATDGARASGRA